MKIKKKNRFLTFCTSFMPGATEMYLGFMKMGLSLTSVFLGFCLIAVFTQIGVLVIPAGIVWMYSFFHANNLAGFTQEELELVEDEYLFGMEALTIGQNQLKKYRKWVAAGLIIIGVILLWNTTLDILYHYIAPELRGILYIIEQSIVKVGVGVFVIAWGVRMIGGKKKELFSDEGSGQVNDEKADD